MARVIPALNNSGWVKDPEAQLRLMFSHALVSDESQSNLYQGTITSLSFIIATYQSRPLQLAIELENKLTTYYQRVFDTVDVTVTAKDPNGTDAYEIDIQIEVSVFGVVYSLAKLTTIENGKLIELVERANR